MSAARESGEHAMFAATGNLDSSSVEQLAENVRRLAHAYSTAPPFQLFVELTRTRNTVYALLEQTRRPRQLNDLYTFAGQLCGLLGVVSLDLGCFDAGAANARAAWAYGQIVDDDGLRSWARAVQATIAFWSGRPREGIKLTNTGLDHVRPGSGEIRLHAVQARSYAVIGAAEEAMAALAAAERAATADTSDELLDAVGGEFAFGDERRLLSAAATHLALGQLGQAEDVASQAIDRFAEIPIAERWIPGEYGARIDLIVARALQGNIEGAEAALTPVLALPSELRTGRLAGRLHGLRRSLSQPRYRGSAEVEQLDDQLEHFVRDSAMAVLPPGMSHHPVFGRGEV
ncbi:XRE family transcriptional regulator [Frankia sp. Cj3]|uniref:XRE family transcriptional regulator n=1 Tax=Frankia sp. Cj3 TaxID=2880976 RepID=UPI001EF61544|nr:XRE family transcriptional regulator [Frankia sp. Cj3]